MKTTPELPSIPVHLRCACCRGAGYVRHLSVTLPCGSCDACGVDLAPSDAFAPDAVKLEHLMYRLGDALRAPEYLTELGLARGAFTFKTTWFQTHGVVVLTASTPFAGLLYQEVYAAAVLLCRDHLCREQPA